MHAIRASYEVVRQLGEGGVGRVYEAVHHPSKRVVAIKTLRTEHADAASQRLLLNEAAAAAQLTHPAIVELVDVGRDDRGGMFLVMELVRGSSLESWGDSFPGLRTVLTAFGEILDALATAHAQGIIHGDLKPGNVLLTEDGRVKLTDFGIAHVIDPLRGAVRRGVQGTPYYMAPEQLVDLEAIAPPTDLYAIGVMLYELLGGREPYPSEGTLGDMLARKMHQVKPLVARAGLAIPPELASLVMRLLDPDPRLRPRFAARVARSLAEIAAVAGDGRVSVNVSASASFGVAPPTIVSSDELPSSKTSTRSLPFSLPCIAGHSPEVALHRLRPLPMLGRTESCARLLALVDEVVGGAGTRGLVVAGRAGEGKTRLLRHGFAEVERTGKMIGAAASFDETISNAQVGLRACMTRLLGSPGPSLGETLASRWRWLESVPQDGVDFARIYDWLGMSERALDTDVVAEVAAMCVLAASRVHPVYLWLDDVAWSRDGAMELMVKLLEQNRARVLVVGTLRSGTAEHPTVREWLLRTARGGAAFEMLPPLSADDRVALIEAAGPVVPEIAREIGKALDEPTLVIVETVRAWIDDGLLVQSDRGYVMREAATLDDLLHTRESVLSRRITTLLETFGEDRAHAERVLCHAALLGLRFEEHVLRSCPDLEPWVDRVLDRALLSGLLRIDGRGAYRFEHRLFLDVIVERCAARKDSSAIFCGTADALVAVYGKRNTEGGLAVANLYRAGGNREAAAQRIADVIAVFARGFLVPACTRAIALFESWLTIDETPAIHPHRGLLERGRGLASYFQLDYATARKHLQRALEIFEAVGPAEQVHNVLFDLSSTYFYQDHFAEAERYVQYVHDETVNPVARARGHHRLSELAVLRLDLDAALRHQRRACAVQLGAVEHRYVLIGIHTLIELLLAAGELEEAAALYERMLVLTATIIDSQVASDIERVSASFDAARGYFAAARGRLVPHCASHAARGDAWQVTGDRALLALCAAALSDEHVDVAVHELIDAYVKVPHDEALTWWAIRSTEARLRGRGRDKLAADLGAVLDARLAHIARAFTDDEPLTEEDAAALPTSAKAASSR